MTLTAQTNIKEIPLEDLVAKLLNTKEIYESKLTWREPDSSHVVALKIERAFLTQSPDSGDNGEDEVTSLMTRALRIAGTRGKKYFPRPRIAPKANLREDNRLCYHCQQKGHMFNDCPFKERGDPPTQKRRKAMIST